MVSHNPEAILSVCRNSIFLEKGKVLKHGNTPDVVSQYESYVLNDQLSSRGKQRFISNEIAEEAKFLDIFFRNSQGILIEKLVSGETVSLCMKIKVLRYIDNLGVKVSIRKANRSVDILFLNSFEDGEHISVSPGVVEVQLQMQNIGLMPGIYNLVTGIHDGNLYQFDVVRSFKFEVIKREKQVNVLRSSFFQPRIWRKI
jgi:lipopolysaccharide transport system ATP-binding protein